MKTLKELTIILFLGIAGMIGVGIVANMVEDANEQERMQK